MTLSDNNMTTDKSKSLIKNTLVLSLGTFCTKGIMFLMTPLLTRWLSQEEYGTFDLLITYVTLLIPFITLDSGEAVFRFLAERKDYSENSEIISSAFVITLFGLALSGILMLFSLIFNYTYKDLLVPFLVLLVCEAVNTFLVFVVRGLKQLPVYALANILFVLSMSLLSWVLIKGANLGLNGILYAYSGGYVFSIIFVLHNVKAGRWLSFERISRQKQKEMLHYSLPLIPNAISWWIINVSNRTVISLVLGTSSNAIFAVASKIPNLCQTLFSVFHLSWQENAVETLNELGRDAYYSKVMNQMLRIVVATSIVILSLNFVFFETLFSQEYYSGYYHVPLLVLAIAFSMLSQFIGGIYIAKMESKKNGMTTTFAAIVSVLFILFTISRIGLYAASLSVLFAYFFLFAIRYYDITKSVKLKFENKTIYTILAFLYFFMCCYINHWLLNRINVSLAILYFAYVMFPYTTRLYKKQN